MPKDIQINLSGLPKQFHAAASGAIDKILSDPDTRLQIDFKVSGTLTFQFSNLGGGRGRARP